MIFENSRHQNVFLEARDSQRRCSSSRACNQYKNTTSSNETGKILGLGNFIWKLKVNYAKVTQHKVTTNIPMLHECSTHSCNSLKKINREHEEYIVLKQLNSGAQPRTNLAAFVDKEIQQPAKDGQYGLLLPQQLEIAL